MYHDIEVLADGWELEQQYRQACAEDDTLERKETPQELTQRVWENVARSRAGDPLTPEEETELLEHLLS